MRIEGLILYGLCDGYFGRDSYGKKRLEAYGKDWVVARDEQGTPLFAYFEDNMTAPEIAKLLSKWSREPGEGVAQQ